MRQVPENDKKKAGKDGEDVNLSDRTFRPATDVDEQTPPQAEKPPANPPKEED